MIAYLISVIAYSRFYARSAHNARQFDAETATVSSHGMWLWFFVPIANLFRPIQGVIGVWRVFHSKAGRQDTETSAFFIWWGFWIVGNAVDNIGNRLPGGAWEFTIDDYNFAEYLTYLLVGIVGSLLTMVSAGGLLSISKRVAQIQQAVLEEHRPAEPASDPQS